MTAIPALRSARPGASSWFWLFQGIESAIFGGLALALLGFAVLWIRRRVS